MPITRAFVQSVRERAAKDPGMPTARLAEELGAPEALVIMALPVHMRLRAKSADANAIWRGMAEWETVEVRPAESSGRGVPASGAIPFGAVSSGSGRSRRRVSFDGLSEKALPEEEVGYIWFVSQKSHDEEVHSVRFFDKQGDHMLSLYLGKDGQGGLDVRTKAAYDAMRKRFGVIPVPKSRCKGCGHCSCGGEKHAH